MIILKYQKTLYNSGFRLQKLLSTPVESKKKKLFSDGLKNQTGGDYGDALICIPAISRHPHRHHHLPDLD